MAAVSVLVLLTLLPGPDMAVVTGSALSSGRGAAAQTAAGVVAGLVSWGLLAVAGLAAVLAASAEAYFVVKVVGAAYLVLLGFWTLWRTRQSVPVRSERLPAGRATGWRAGLLTNLLNPKIAVFYTGLLPQLVPAGMPTSTTMLGLVLIHAVLSLTWLNAYAWLLTRSRALMTRPGARRVLQRVTGVALVGFGVRLAVASR